jgi:hypothetical protein
MFAVDLANRLGFVHVNEMLEVMSPTEFDERYAHGTIEPEGRRNAVIIQAEIIAAVKLLAGILTNTEPKAAEVVPDDLMPKFKSEVKKKRKPKTSLKAGFAQVKQMMGF